MIGEHIYKEGKLDGIQKDYSYGLLMLEEIYKNGISCNIYKYWFSNGQLMPELVKNETELQKYYDINDGKVHEIWYKNGYGCNFINRFKLYLKF